MSADSGQRWWWAVAGVAAAGLVLRIVYVVVWMNPSTLPGDAAYYHHGANLLAAGKGFVNPAFFVSSGGRIAVAAADHPPAYTVFLAAASWVGLRSPLDHQIWSALLGTGSIVVVALLGREVAGRRAGLIAAVAAAVYPNLWLLDGMLHSETLLVFAVAGATLVAYRYLRRPRPGTAAALGAVCGVAALTRAEQVLLVPLLAIPAAWVGTRGTRARRAAVAGLSVAAAVAVVAPWSIHNLTRFERFEPFTTTGGTTLAVANCPLVYHDPDALGSWAFSCWREHSSTEPSVVDAEARSEAIRFMTDNAGRLPVVMAARLGRTWGLYRPAQTLRTDLWGRPPGLVDLGGALYYLVAAAAVAGAMTLRRRRVPLWPLAAHVVVAAVTSLAVYGSPRFRVGAEVSLVVLAAVALDAALARARVTPRHEVVGVP